MHDEQKKFYNAASAQYSEIRYEGPLISYTQFVFRRRLRIFLKLLEKILTENKKVSFIEIGCADGIVMNAIDSKFSSSVEKILGVDVSDMMLEKAKAKYPNTRFSYALRGQEGGGRYDIALELGVHVADLENEIRYIKNHLKENGHFFYSTAGKNSLYAKLKLRSAAYAKDYIPYDDVETVLARHFDIIEARPYGLFIPKLWSVPFLARIIQPAEAMLGKIAPSLFHEKIYLLKNK